MENNMSHYWTQAAENYGKIIDDELNSFRPEVWKAIILGEVATPNQLKILDVGTGPGFFSIILSQAGHEVTGIDCSEGMLEIAKKNAKKHGVWPVLKMMDSHALNFKDNSFDLILSRNVTWTLKNPTAVYESWHRILKPGGKLLIFDANWHHHFFDAVLMEEVKVREQRCLEIFGSTFSDSKSQEEQINIELLPLSKVIRPDWDINALKGCSFIGVDYIRDITEKIWDAKEKMLFGASPMFMISAVKE